MSSMLDRKSLGENGEGRPSHSYGFSLVELLVGMTFLTIGLLAVAAMFPLSYVVVNESGKMTMTLTAARQIMEDVRSVPFENLPNLNGFDTSNSATLPANDPEREIVRKWRYALAGEGNGFTFTSAEKSRLASLGTAGVAFGGRGRITVASQSATLRLVTVTVSIPRGRDIEIATLISRM